MKTGIPFIYPQTIYKLTKTYRNEIESRKVLRDYFVYAIEDRKKCKDNEEYLMIDGILQNENKFASRREIFMHLDAFLHTLEPTAMSLSHTILLLAMNHEVQEKLHDELKMVEIDGLDQNSMSQLKYLDMVFKESSRLMPPIPIISREALEEFEIQPNVKIPEQTCMLINIYTLQRDKKYWGENANDFYPERFSDENLKKIIPNTYIPFSAGRRMCIAHKYSKFAVKIFIARLIQKFKFSTSLTELEPRSYLMLNLCTPHSVSINRRT